MKHLTQYEREKIEFYLRLKMGIRLIARKLGRDHSVIGREIQRNKGARVRYSAGVATRIEKKRRLTRKGRKLEKDIFLHDYVVRELKGGVSPDVIAGRLKSKPPSELLGKTVSH